MGPCFVHLGAMFCFFYNIFASRCLKWLKFSVKSHACQVEEYTLMLNCLDHIMDMSGPYWSHVLAIYTISLLLHALNANFFYRRVMHLNERKLSILNILDHIRAIHGSYQSRVLVLYTISILLEVWNSSNFL